MMTPAEIVRTRLLAVPRVTAIVGSRIYTLMLPQNFTGTTAIRLQRISERDTIHLRGAGGQWVARVQVDALAPTVAEAYALDTEAHGDGAGSALAGFLGPVGTTYVQSILPDAAREVFEPNETQLIRVIRDYFVTFTEHRVF